MFIMINGRELITIIAISVIITITLSFKEPITIILYSLLAVFLVLIVNVLAKKIASFFLDSEIEIKLWKIRRFGFKPNAYFKKEFPAGAVFPVIVAIVSLGYLYWMACLVFDVKTKVYRAAKRWGLYSFSEITESHIGLIAFWGILANVVFAVIGYLIGFPDFARFNIYYAAFNMLPFSDLDGNKIFFGNLILWSFLAALVLIGLGYAFLLV